MLSAMKDGHREQWAECLEMACLFIFVLALWGLSLELTAGHKFTWTLSEKGTNFSFPPENSLNVLEFMWMKLSCCRGYALYFSLVWNCVWNEMTQNILTNILAGVDLGWAYLIPEPLSPSRQIRHLTSTCTEEGQPSPFPCMGGLMTIDGWLSKLLVLHEIDFHAKKLSCLCVRMLCV